ncbi:MAG TPA: N-acetyl-gamma-glutamyl-phosphate reductase [Solirubrobacteraceae bacterium]|nr:N-acetyl-gamma-glutamyl-phosphate reductase [Solirubrobacteraceae bacterium]
MSCVASASRVLVAGGSGYAGALAARLVDRHPDFELASVTSRGDAGRRLTDLYPHHRVDAVMTAFDIERDGDVDAAIVAYPHGAAAPVVELLRERGVRVVDLSADFRLRDRDTYAHWYGEHGAPDLFGCAVYGLPELYGEQIAGADLVANPGCYPTATVLALTPLARSGTVADVTVDAKSGVSGAGRAATSKTHFVTVDENVTPYGVGAHRHMPEIDQELAALGAEVVTTFTPHLIPLDQGELVSCYVTTTERWDQDQVDAAYGGWAKDLPFVEIVATPPGVRDVRDTNICAICARADARTGKVFVFAAIDNLWKGAASQAVQNLNLMFGLSETAGIEP